jgi:hypothetical protein
VTATGVKVLLAETFVQSELWLKLPAPKEEMIRALEEHDLESETSERTSGKL